MSDKSSQGLIEITEAIGYPIQARAFVRRGGARVFGGFIIVGDFERDSDYTDEIWEVEIQFRRKVGGGRSAEGLRLDQVMCGGYLKDPSRLEVREDDE